MHNNGPSNTQVAVHNGKLQVPRHAKVGGEEARRGGDGSQFWCSFHKSTTHSDADCRNQHRNSTNEGIATHSRYPTVRSARDPPSVCDPEHLISVTAGEAPTSEEAMWPFGPTNEPVDTSGGLFGAFGGITGEETGGLAFMVDEGPMQVLKLRERITGGLATGIRALAIVVVIIHYMWLLLGSSSCARVVSTTTNGQAEMFGVIISAEGGSTLNVHPAAGPRSGGSNVSVNVLVNSGASAHYLDDAIIPRLWDKLEKYQVLDVPREISTTGGGQLDGVAQGLLCGNVVDDKEVWCIMEGRSVISMETPSRLLPSPSEETLPQVLRWSNAVDDHNYVADDDSLRDLRDYISLLEPFRSVSADHITVGDFQQTRRRLDSLRGSARSPRRTYRTTGTEELQNCGSREFCPTERRWKAFTTGAFHRPPPEGNPQEEDVIRDRDKGAVIITLDNYSKSLLERCVWQAESLHTHLVWENSNMEHKQRF